MDSEFASLLKEQYHSASPSNKELSRYTLYDPFYNKKHFKHNYIYNYKYKYNYNYSYSHSYNYNYNYNDN